MHAYAKVGRDIIIGTGLAAKHWSGAIVFGTDAIHLCPDVSIEALAAGVDSGVMAACHFGLIGGGLANLVSGKKADKAAGWKNHVTDLSTLPKSITGHPDWPVKPIRRPVITIGRSDIEKIELVGGRILIMAHGECYKLGLRIFGRPGAIRDMQALGWDIPLVEAPLLTRKRLACILALAAVGIAIYPFTPGARQERNMAAARRHAESIAPGINADPRFAQVHLAGYAGEGGMLYVGGYVSSQADLNALRKRIAESTPPVGVKWLVGIEDTSARNETLQDTE